MRKLIMFIESRWSICILLLVSVSVVNSSSDKDSLLSSSSSLPSAPSSGSFSSQNQQSPDEMHPIGSPWYGLDYFLDKQRLSLPLDSASILSKQLRNHDDLLSNNNNNLNDYHGNSYSSLNLPEDYTFLDLPDKRVDAFDRTQKSPFRFDGYRKKAAFTGMRGKKLYPFTMLPTLDSPYMGKERLNSLKTFLNDGPVSSEQNNAKRARTFAAMRGKRAHNTGGSPFYGTIG